MDLQFSTACLPYAPLRNSFAAARALQVGSLELALTPLLLRRGPERVACLAADHGVVVRSLDLSPLGELVLEAAMVPRLAAFATALPGCGVVALPTPRDWSLLPGGLNGFLALIAIYTAALGDRASLTLINAPGGTEDAPGPLDRFPQLRRVVEEWELGYTFDTSHAASAGWVITEPLPQMGARLRNIHLNDFRQSVAQSDWQAAPLLPAGVRPWQLGRAPGEGVLPLRAFLRALRRREYTGLITLNLREVGARAWWPPHLTGRLIAATGFCRAALDTYHPRQSGPSRRPPGRPEQSAEKENEGRHA
jgi:sugar phosphate isomerase/epimerase